MRPRWRRTVMLGSVILLCAVQGYGASAEISPLKARAHLPLPLRIHDVTFISEKTGEKSVAPGTLGDGYSVLRLGPKSAQWWHGDVVEYLKLDTDAKGNFTATSQTKKAITGRIDIENGRVLWGEQWYRIPVPYRAAGTHWTFFGAPPFWKPNLKGNAGTVKVRGRETVSVSFGSLCTRTLGRKGDRLVFDYMIEIEHGTTIYRHALPVSKGTPTIDIDEEGKLKTSFDRSKSILLYNGITGGEARDVPAIEWQYRSIKLEDHPRFLLARGDLLEGAGKVPQSGDKVTIRTWSYKDKQLTALRSDAKQGETYTYVYGQEKSAEVRMKAIEGMKVGGWRRLSVWGDIADSISDWAGPVKKGELLYLDVHLVAVE